MSKHTPGPWTVSDKAYGLFIRDARDYSIIGLCNSTPDKVANANLIAAAPEMLEALKSIASPRVDQGISMKDIVILIAKAQGETNDTDS